VTAEPDTFQNVGDVAAKVVDRWSWWQNALKGEIGNITTTPEQGYFRTRNKNGPWEPVAIWVGDDGEWLAYRDGKEVHADDIWTWCCRNPISFEAYEKAMRGEGFDDEPPAPVGHNSASSDDPQEALWLEFLGEKEQAEEFLRKGIKTQDDADKASIWKDRIMKIKSRAAALFKAEKQPILDEGKRIDDRWRSLAHDRDSETVEMVNKLRLGMEAFLKVKKAEEDARQRKARQEFEAAQRAAAEAARKAQESDQQSEREREAARQEAERLAAQARAAEQEAEARKVNAGRTGARTTIRVEKRGEIVDYDALLMALKDRAEIKEIVQSLANRAAKSGFELAGMKIVEVERVV